MKHLIESLLKNIKLDYLDLGARFKLTNMLKTLDDKKELTREEKRYLQWVKKHIMNIDPHIEIIQVNGEEVPVQFVTKV